MFLEDDAVLGFFPFAVRRVKGRRNNSEISLVRVGCAKITAVSTSETGLEAVKLLRRGYSVAETTAEMGRRLQRDQVDLQPLLTALHKARMVRAVNGTIINDDEVSASLRLAHRMEWLSLALRRFTVRLAIRSLPVSAAYRLLFRMKPGWPRRKRRSTTQSARRNLERAFPNFPARKLDGIAAEYTAEQIRIGLDLEFLSHLPEVEAGRWLRNSCEFTGLEYLDAAIARGKGALLLGFHLSSSHFMLLLLLWLRGYSFTGAGNIMGYNTGRPLPWNDPALSQKLGGCGRVNWHTSVHFASALSICRTLERGGMALVFPDGFFVRPSVEEATYFGHNAAVYPGAVTEVRFLGREIQVNTGVHWICQQSEAPVIPIRLQRLSGARFRVAVEPELALTRNCPVATTTVELYRELEREVCARPADWIYWRRFDSFSARPRASEAQETSDLSKA